jgi:hypothetical protein
MGVGCKKCLRLVVLCNGACFNKCDSVLYFLLITSFRVMFNILPERLHLKYTYFSFINDRSKEKLVKVKGKVRPRSGYKRE